MYANFMCKVYKARSRYDKRRSATKLARRNNDLIGYIYL